MSSKLENTIRCGMSSVVEEDAPFKDKPNILRRRCLRIRHASASCTACVEACHSKALSILNNQPILKPSVCSGCGACESACPTEAIQIGSPSQEEIFERFKNALDPNKISFACKEASSEASSIPVVCFARINPGLLLLAKAAGAKDIELVSGKCENCLRNNSGNPTKSLCLKTENLSALLGIPIDISVRVKDSELNLGRRRFLGAFLDKARTSELLSKESEDSHSSQLNEWKRVPDSHLRLITALRMLSMKNPDAKISEEKTFCLPAIDHSKCSGCLLCVSICPTGCLVTEKHGDSIGIHAITSSCTGCGICSDICYSGACRVNKEVSVKELVDSKNKFLAEISINPNLFSEEAEDKIARMFDAPIYRS